MKNAKEKIPVETDIKVYSPEQVAEILQVTTRTINLFYLYIRHLNFAHRHSLSITI